MKKKYNDKKALYESIMKDVAKTVKKAINEYEYTVDVNPQTGWPNYDDSPIKLEDLCSEDSNFKIYKKWKKYGVKLNDKNEIGVDVRAVDANSESKTVKTFTINHDRLANVFNTIYVLEHIDYDFYNKYCFTINIDNRMMYKVYRRYLMQLDSSYLIYLNDYAEKIDPDELGEFISSKRNPNFNCGFKPILTK